MWSGLLGRMPAAAGRGYLRSRRRDLKIPRTGAGRGGGPGNGRRRRARHSIVTGILVVRHALGVLLLLEQQTTWTSLRATKRLHSELLWALTRAGITQYQIWSISSGEPKHDFTCLKEYRTETSVRIGALVIELQPIFII